MKLLLNNFKILIIFFFIFNVVVSFAGTIPSCTEYNGSGIGPGNWCSSASGCWSWDGLNYSCVYIDDGDVADVLGGTHLCGSNHPQVSPATCDVSPAMTLNCNLPNDPNHPLVFVDNAGAVDPDFTWWADFNCGTAGVGGCPDGMKCVDVPNPVFGNTRYTGFQGCVRSPLCCLDQGQQRPPDDFKTQGFDCCNPNMEFCENAAGTEGECQVCAGYDRGATCTSIEGDTCSTDPYVLPDGTALPYLACCGPDPDLLCVTVALDHEGTAIEECAKIPLPLECPPGSGYVANGELCWKGGWPTSYDLCDDCASGFSEKNAACSSGINDPACEIRCRPPLDTESYNCTNGPSPNGECVCADADVCLEDGTCGANTACTAYGNDCLINAPDPTQAHLECCPTTGSQENVEPMFCDDEADGTPGNNAGKCDVQMACGNYEGAPCSDSQPCCTVPLFNCDQGSCTAPLVKGTCLDTGKCGAEANKCDAGWICNNGGQCEYQPDACGVNDGLIPAGGIEFVPFEDPITDIARLLGGITTLLYGAAILLGLILIIISGYKYMTSEGDPGKVREAQEQLTSSVIGIIFVMLSVFILDIIISSLIGAGP